MSQSQEIKDCNHQKSPISHPEYPDGYCIKCGISGKKEIKEYTMNLTVDGPSEISVSFNLKGRYFTIKANKL